LIQNDLQTLSAIDRMQVERYKQSIPSKNLAFSLGALYVIEGSTLGGSVIAPKLEKTLDSSHALTFYQCYGVQKFDNFIATMKLIESHISSKTDKNDLLNGAVFTFDSLDKWAKTFSALPECCDV
jgi:heme oxygenase